MKSREIGNAVLHLVVGFGLVLAACWSYWTLIGSTAIWAFLREQAQHRYKLERSDAANANLYWVEKRTFFDFSWLGWKQVFEIGQWTIGATVACVLWYFIGG
jgi:hypothetical protein